MAAPQCIFGWNTENSYTKKRWMQKLVIREVKKSEKMPADALYAKMTTLHKSLGDTEQHTTVGFYRDQEGTDMIGETREHIYMTFAAEEVEQARLEYLNSPADEGEDD
ncbi:hypothetical protein NLI96_g12581 [Meripilus lineatus]|uniref:Uncharacterized protein n=1 Tax=Meripilus lineatus TaxID=2056292 RepID=A0AAD5UPM0_9APHY|nr:hypothetical protein NLI96_g12581 [Physisporinus lineatus]